MDSAERLDGGNVGGAVRIGDTVRRSAGPWTAAVHALLTHLATKRFTAAPRPLGFDEQGREVLTFLEGQVVGSGCFCEAAAHGAKPRLRKWRRALPAIELRDLDIHTSGLRPVPLQRGRRRSTRCRCPGYDLTSEDSSAGSERQMFRASSSPAGV